MHEMLIEFALVLARLSLLTFGESSTVLAEMERELVGRDWLTSAQFAESVALGFITPGPSTLMVVPMGYAAAGPVGAAVALIAFWGPTIAIALAATVLWRRVRESPWPQAFRAAVMPIAFGLIGAAVYGLGQITVRSLPAALIALVVALILLRTRISAPGVMLGAAVFGAVFLQP